MFSRASGRQTGSAKCLIRTRFSLLSGRLIETENGEKGGSRNTRTGELKEPESRRHKEVNKTERERPRTKTGGREN